MNDIIVALDRLFTQTILEYDKIVRDLAEKSKAPHAANVRKSSVRIREEVLQFGARVVAKRLLSTSTMQTGFTDLWSFGHEINRPDLKSKYSFEAGALDPQFEPLFTDDERAKARERLDQINRPHRPARQR